MTLIRLNADMVQNQSSRKIRALEGHLENIISVWLSTNSRIIISNIGAEVKQDEMSNMPIVPLKISHFCSRGFSFRPVLSATSQTQNTTITKPSVKFSLEYLRYLLKSFQKAFSLQRSVLLSHCFLDFLTNYLGIFKN